MSTIARATLTSGTAHDDVHELGRILAEHGFENSVSRGQNPFGLVDESVLNAVNLARAKFGIGEEADIPSCPPEHRRNYIGPVLWDGLLTEAGNARKLKASATS